MAARPGFDHPTDGAVPLLHAAIPPESPLPAVQCGERELSYRELHRRAAGIAAELHRAGVRQDTPVGICTADPLLFVPAVLGVLQSGGAYVPLDPSWPSARYAGIARRIGMGTVLAGPGAVARVTGQDFEVCDLGSIGEQESRSPAVQPAGTLAYLILTSGSTGEPKAVGVSHEAAIRSLYARRESYGGEVHGFLWHSPPAFDSSIVGLFWALAEGGTLVAPEPDVRIDPRELVRLIRDRKITHVLCLPRVWREILGCATPTDLETLTTTIIAGEAAAPLLPLEHAEISDSQLWNEYGPAEGSVWATHYRCDAVGELNTVPIGTPRSGIDVAVVRDDLSLCEFGEVGEIWLSGPTLARGYPGAPGQTADRFVPCPFSGPGVRAYRTGDLALRRPDGVLEFRGRRDDQIKIGGVRVELAEVERGLLAIEGVTEAAVLVQEGTAGRSSLTGCLVLAEPATVDDVTRAVSDVLPAPMVPARLLAVPSLPRNSNGKIDRQTLAESLSLEDSATSIGATSGPADDAVAELLETVLDAWRVVLRTPDLPAEADLFTAGGDSISAVMICGKLAESGVTLTPFDLFHARSPMRVAKLLAERSEEGTASAPSPAGQSSTAAARAGRGASGRSDDDSAWLPLTPIQRWFVDTQPEPVLDHWNFSVSLTMEGADPDTVRAALTGVLNRHPMLSAIYQPASDSADWRVRPARGPVPLVLEFVESIDESTVTERIEYWQRSLSLSSGPVARLLWFETTGVSRRSRAVVIVHHLVMDAVSLRVLVADLDNALRAGRPPGPAPDPSGWVNAHAGEIQSGRYDPELEFWLDNARQSGYAGGNAVAGSEADAHHLFHRLTGDAVRQFVAAAHDRRTGSTETLLAAVAAGARETFPEMTALGVDVETHGRPGHGPVGSAGAVHWFTSFYPVPVPLKAASAGAEALAAATEALATVPGEGLGFLALAHGRSELPETGQFDRIPAPLLGLNYLGRLDRSFTVGTAEFDIDVTMPAQRSGSARRRHLLDLDCFVDDDGLVFRWTYTSGQIPVAEVEKLASATAAGLQACLEVTDAGA